MGFLLQIDLGCTKLTLGLLYGILSCILGLFLAISALSVNLVVLTGSLFISDPVLCGESRMGVFNIFGLAPFGVLLSLLYSHIAALA